MDIEQIKKETTERMQTAFQHIHDKVQKMRKGKAHSSLLEGIKVSSYGSEQALQHIAGISCPDSRSLVISPYDQNTIKDIESAIIKSDLNMAPQRDGKVIRLKIPELTGERREELIRAFKKDMEKARVEFRQIRKIMNEKVRKALKDKQISEDVEKDTEQDIQKTTDQFIEKINALSDKKISELKTV